MYNHFYKLKIKGGVMNNDGTVVLCSFKVVLFLRIFSLSLSSFHCLNFNFSIITLNSGLKRKMRLGKLETRG